MAKFRVGVLTGGGDTSALNATLYGIVKAAEEKEGEVIGFRRGWAGVLLPDKEYYIEEKKDGKVKKELLQIVTGEYVTLNLQNVNPRQGGSIILSSRTNLAKIHGAVEDAVKRLDNLGIDYFLPIGGDDTTAVTLIFTEYGLLPRKVVVAVPKTIDNDNGSNGPNGVFNGIEGMVNVWVHGFPTAVNNGKNYAESTYSTAYSHERVMWIEAMGRKAGFLALAMGDRSMADMTIIPEVPIDLEDISQRTLEIYRQKGYFFGVASEGAINSRTNEIIAEDPTLIDLFGNTKLGGVAKIIAEQTKEHFKKHRVNAPYFNGQIPEYVYRGGPPTQLDREVSIQAGYNALMRALDNSGVNGHMAVLLWDGKNLVYTTMPLEQALNIDTKGKIIPRSVPIDKENPEKGFYDPKTMNITGLGKRYVELLQVPPIEFTPWRGEIYR